MRFSCPSGFDSLVSSGSDTTVPPQTPRRWRGRLFLQLWKLPLQIEISEIIQRLTPSSGTKKTKIRKTAVPTISYHSDMIKFSFLSIENFTKVNLKIVCPCIQGMSFPNYRNINYYKSFISPSSKPCSDRDVPRFGFYRKVKHIAIIGMVPLNHQTLLPFPPLCSKLLHFYSHHCSSPYLPLHLFTQEPARDYSKDFAIMQSASLKKKKSFLI